MTPGSSRQEAATAEALNDGADAVMTRMDALLEEALDEPMELDGPTPRETIEESLGALQTIDRGLKRIAAGGGDAKERELLLAWMNLMSQWTDDANTAAIADHKADELAGEPKEGKAKAKAGKAKAGEGAEKNQ